mmetsp:Transcript_14656/g.32916  ORF Transcript_14656/g.32916 Transcript_14656/m.32916 type:complete len:309 (-) Transcript_14656:83-1009(-)
MWGDLKLAVYDVRLSAPIIALLGMLLAYHITIAPYRHNIVGGGNTPMKDLNGIRPLLDSSTLLSIQQIMLRQENKLQLPVDLDTGSFGGLRTSGGTVSYRWVPTVNKFGTHELPDFFYEGVLFGISAQNSHDVMYSSEPMLTPGSLYEDLQAMQPQPTFIMERTAQCNQTDWIEAGYAVYFSYADLQKQGLLSGDKLFPWKRVQEPVMWIARKFKQVYITVWYPHQFGAKGAQDTLTPLAQSQIQRHRYENIIQTVIPTRTGMDSLKSTAAVWLVAVNMTEIIRPPRMYRAALGGNKEPPELAMYVQS